MKSTLITILIIILCSLAFRYFDTTFRRPQTVHHWRQSDCASTALNYYQHGMHFLQPETHNLTSDNDKSGYTATSEIPWLYYFVAVLYKIFGFHDFIFRIVNTIIFLTAFYFLHKTFNLLFNNFLWSIAFSIIFISSSVMVYYGNNFLSDSTALSFSIMGWYFFIRYLKQNEETKLYYALLLFFIAGTCKISAGISTVAVFCIYLLSKTNLLKENKKLFSNNLKILSLFGLNIIITGAWILYAKHYNNIHATGYFSTTTFPIWKLNKETIHEILHTANLLWVNEYYSPISRYFFFAAFAFIFVTYKKNMRTLITLTSIIFIGVIIYLLLWFETLNNHDYYVLNLFVLPLIILFSLAYYIEQNHSSIKKNWIAIIILISFSGYNLWYTSEHVRLRYFGWWNYEYAMYKDFYSIDKYLNNSEIKPTDYVISIPDNTHNSLYLMNRKGWTQCIRQMDSTEISRLINLGAKYLFVNTGDTLQNTSYAKPFMKNKIGGYGKIEIYKIR